MLSTFPNQHLCNQTQIAKQLSDQCFAMSRNLTKQQKSCSAVEWSSKPVCGAMPRKMPLTLLFHLKSKTQIDAFLHIDLRPLISFLQWVANHINTFSPAFFPCCTSKNTKISTRNAHQTQKLLKWNAWAFTLPLMHADRKSQILWGIRAQTCRVWPPDQNPATATLLPFSRHSDTIAFRNKFLFQIVRSFCLVVLCCRTQINFLLSSCFSGRCQPKLPPPHWRTLLERLLKRRRVQWVCRKLDLS